jgi:hypothetical protein
MDKDTQSVGMFNRHDLYQSMFDEIEGSSKKKPPRRDSCENRTRRGKDKSPKLNGGTPGTLIEEKSKLY